MVIMNWLILIFLNLKKELSDCFVIAASLCPFNFSPFCLLSKQYSFFLGLLVVKWTHPNHYILHHLTNPMVWLNNHNSNPNPTILSWAWFGLKCWYVSSARIANHNSKKENYLQATHTKSLLLGPFSMYYQAAFLLTKPPHPHRLGSLDSDTAKLSDT